jgi:hypothetical protein
MAYRIFLVVSTMVLLASCGGTSVGAAATPVAADLPKVSSSYEVITVTKAEDMKAYLAFSKETYAICAELKSLQKLPVKPYPAIPSDFIIEKNIYSSDGENFYERTEKTGASDASPDEQCLVVFGTESNTKITRGNVTQSIDEDVAGVITVDSGQNNSQYTQLPVSKKSELSVFSIRQNKQGIAMRCLDKSLLNNAARDYDECVFDGTNESSLFNANGKPIALYLRLPPLVIGSVLGTTKVTEVKTIEIGKKIDPKIFTFK